MPYPELEFQGANEWITPQEYYIQRRKEQQQVSPQQASYDQQMDRKDEYASNAPILGRPRRPAQQGMENYPQQAPLPTQYRDPMARAGMDRSGDRMGLPTWQDFEKAGGDYFWKDKESYDAAHGITSGKAAPQIDLGEPPPLNIEPPRPNQFKSQAAYNNALYNYKRSVAERQQKWQVERQQKQSAIQGLVDEGYTPEQIQAFIARGGDVRTIPPKPKAPLSPMEAQKQLDEEKLRKIRLDKALNPPPSESDFSDEKGRAYRRLTYKQGMTRDIPRQEMETGFDLYRPEEKGFEGVRYDKEGRPVKWSMARDKYGAAVDLKEGIAPPSGTQPEKETGQVFDTWNTPKGVVRAPRLDEQGRKIYDPNAIRKSQSEPDKEFNIPLLENKDKIDIYGNPIEGKRQTEPTQAAKQLYSNLVAKEKEMKPIIAKLEKEWAAAKEDLMTRTKRLPSKDLQTFEDERSALQDERGKWEQRLAQAKKAQEMIQARRKQLETAMGPHAAKLKAGPTQSSDGMIRVQLPDGTVKRVPQSLAGRAQDEGLTILD